MATKTKRTKPDAFLNNATYGNPIADGIHHSIMPVDEIATTMENKWGCDRLPGLVSPESAGKFGSAKAKLDEAVLNNDPVAVVKRSGIMVRGWAALDQEATKLGHKPLEPNIWTHITDKGYHFAIAQGNADAHKAIASDPEMEGVAVWSMAEIGIVLESRSMALVNSIKDTFPGAMVSDVVPVDAEEMNDECPF